MATNNAVSFNQLKKSVFNMKNYINYNANNPYAVKTLLDETIAIDANCNITNNGNAISIYKNESEDGYNCYFCLNNTNAPSDVNEEFISMKIYINDKLIYNQVPKHITSGIALSTNSIIDKYLDKDTNVIKFVSLSMYHNKKVYYDENGKYHSDDEENTQSYKAIVSIKKGQQNPGTVRIVGEFLTENKNYPGINCFKSDTYGSLTYASNIDDTGVGSINFSNDPSPDYTIIIPCSSMNNSFKNTCSSGFILGSANKLNGINYYSILGFNNTIERKVNASYNESFVNIIGQYNTYKADASTVNYKPVSIIGNYINACNSGLYIGMAGTFEKDDIMGIADGTAKKEKIIFRVKRDGRVKASAPTENDDLTNKKYVDDKVAGVVNSAPETLDTLQELATALGNDPNFATTVVTQIGKKVDKVEGMSLTHNDLTNELKANYDAAYNYSQVKHSYNDLTDKPTIPSIDGLATETYVDSKTSMENVIYEGNGTGPDVVSDYWTGCPVVSGNGCWVINKQIEFDSSKPNPYYLLCDTTLYSPENSTFDAANSAWIYPKVPNRGTIFICNKYNGENKLVLPWDDVNSPTKMKLYTKTELATAISDGDLEATSDEVKAMLINVLGGDYSGKKN